MYSYFTFLELVKAISVHRAHRLLPEATLILCTWRNRLSVTVSGFDRLLSGNATNYRRKNTRFVSSNDSYRDCPFHPLLLKTVAAFVGSQIRPTLGLARTRNGQSFAKYAPSAFTDEVNYIIDNEKPKALLVGVRSPRACVTMPSAANQ
jgi:hypothetical protein